MARSLKVDIIGDSRSLERALGRAQSSSGRLGGALRGLGKVALGAGAVLGGGLAVAAKIGFDEFKQGQLVAAQTQAVLKSTGGVANVTAGQIDNLAESLMKKTGIDDEVIKSGANLLLTFKDIRNEAGKGNDIFSQATTMLQDMSVALGQDTKQSAIQLGKALNDPIKGVTALRRVGIQMTTAQEEQIKAFVEAGDVMGAQKVILKELESQFGGSAEAAGKTFAGQLNILKETFSNTAGEIVGKFMPLIIKLATTLLPLVARGFAFVSEVVTGLIAPFTKASETFGHTGNEAFKVGVKIKTGFKAAVHFVRGQVIPFFRQKVWPIFLILADIVRDAFRRIVTVIRRNRPQLMEIWGAIKKAAELFVWVLKTLVLPWLRFIFTEVLPRVIGVAIKTLAGIIRSVRAIKNFFVGTLQPAILSTFRFFSDRVQIVVNKVQAVINKLKDMVNFIRSIPDKVGGAISAVGGFFGKVAGAIGDGIVDARQSIRGMRAAQPGGLTPNILDDLGLAQAMGLTLTSGFRPGAITSTGNKSLHSTGHAIDVAGTSSQMAAFFRAELGRPGIRELLYSPIGGWYGAGGIVPLSGSVLRDHFSHVHVGVADNGAMLPPRSANLIFNRTRHWEPVGPPLAGGNGHGTRPIQIVLQVDRRTLASVLVDADREHRRSNGGRGLLPA